MVRATGLAFCSVNRVAVVEDSMTPPRLKIKAPFCKSFKYDGIHTNPELKRFRPWVPGDSKVFIAPASLRVVRQTMFVTIAPRLLFSAEEARRVAGGYLYKVSEGVKSN